MTSTLLPIALCLLIQSTVLLTLGLIAMRMARRRGPAVQSLAGRATLAGVGLALLLAGPLTGRVRGVWHVALAGRAPQIRSNAAGIQVAAPPETGGGRVRAAVKFRPLDGSAVGRAALDRAALPSVPFAEVPPVPRPTSPSMPTPPPPVSGGAATCRGVGSLWASGSALLLLWLAVCQWHLTRLRGQARPLTSGPAADMLAALTPRPPALLAHPSVRSPFLAGIRRSAIFLPTTHETDFDPTALRAILTHELAHLERRDTAWTLAARLLSALLWPQPLLWVLCRRLEQTGEEACDLAVLAQDCPPRAYAACLLTLAERHPLGRRERALGAGVAPFHSSLGQRIGRILDKGNRAMSTVTLRLRLTVAILAVAAAFGAVFLVSSAPAQSPAPGKPALTTEQQRLIAMRVQDAKNLRDIGIAFTLYTQDHDEFFPDAAHWMDELSPYLKDKTVFFDPFQPDARRYGYAFNRSCSRKALAAFAHPWETVEVFDSTLNARNASDMGQSLRAAEGTGNGGNYLLVDGHVKRFHGADRPSFAIKWDRRFLRMTPAHPSAGLPTRLSNPPHIISQGGLVTRQTFLASATQTDAELSNARFLAGLTPVQGPGVVVTLNDSKKKISAHMPPGFTPPNLIHDSDINAVVNELKAAGAEAVAVNGQRLVATSSVRTAGPSILINFTPTAPPYVIKAIGDPKTLAAAMNLSGGIATQLKAYDSAMFSVKEAGAMTLPAYSGGSAPRYAKPASFTTPSSANGKTTRRMVGYGLKVVFSKTPCCAAVKGSPAAEAGVPFKDFNEIVAVNGQAATLPAPQLLALLQSPPPLRLQLRSRDKQLRSFTLSSRGMFSVPVERPVTEEGARQETKSVEAKQAELAAARLKLTETRRQIEEAIHGMLPHADAETLSVAFKVEQGYGWAANSLEFVREYKDWCRKKKNVEGYASYSQREMGAEVRLKDSLFKEARVFPKAATSQERLSRVHALVRELNNDEFKKVETEIELAAWISVMQERAGPTI